METDIGNPIDYDPMDDPLNKNHEKHEDSTLINDSMVQDQSYYVHPSEMMYHQQQYQDAPKTDFLSNVDKSTWIIAFAVFLLGFFMGKTMQPVILKYS
jgi:hypothetical protein